MTGWPAAIVVPANQKKRPAPASLEKKAEASDAAREGRPADGPVRSSCCYDGRLFYFYIFQKKNYRNIFLVSDFTVIYPYRSVGGRQGTYRPAEGQ